MCRFRSTFYPTLQQGAGDNRLADLKFWGDYIQQTRADTQGSSPCTFTTRSAFGFSALASFTSTSSHTSSNAGSGTG